MLQSFVSFVLKFIFFLSIYISIYNSVSVFDSKTSRTFSPNIFCSQLNQLWQLFRVYVMWNLYLNLSPINHSFTHIHTVGYMCRNSYCWLMYAFALYGFKNEVSFIFMNNKHLRPFFFININFQHSFSRKAIKVAFLVFMSHTRMI